MPGLVRMGLRRVPGVEPHVVEDVALLRDGVLRHRVADGREERRDADAERDAAHHHRGEARRCAAGSSRRCAGDRGAWPARRRRLFAAQRRHRVEVHHLAVQQVDLPVRARRALRAVRDHHDGGAAAVDVLQQVEDLARHQRVEVAGRLVRQDEPRVARQDARDGDALLLAARELRGQVAQARGEADERQRALDPLLAVGRGQAAVAQRHVDVVEHVEVGDQVEALEDEPDLLVPDARHLVVVEAAHVLPVEQVGAALERVEQARDVQERRLARARGTHHRHELAVPHVQREVGERVGLDQVRPVHLADVPHRHHGEGPPSTGG